MATTVTPPRLSDLRAYTAEGIGHVMPTGRSITRHPCGEPIRPERFAHPARTRCVDCIAKVGIVVPAPTELEQRAMWGDR